MGAPDDVTYAEYPVPPEAYERYRGKWIALDGATIVAVADTLEELWADKRLMVEAAAYHVPDTPYTFFSPRAL